jgi:hypothetical protein
MNFLNFKEKRVGSNLEILEFNYWEHFKVQKDLSLILPLNHPRRISIEKSMNDLLEKINLIKNESK